MSQDGQIDNTARIGALERLPQPVVAFAADYPPQGRTVRHSHARVQFIHAEEGTMTVVTDRGAWVVPRGLALWMPAGMDHEVRAATRLSMRTLYIAPDAVPWLPDDCRVVTVSPLLRELILRATTLPAPLPSGGAEERLMAVLLDELRDLETTPLHLPMPQERRLRIVCEALLADPADTRDLKQWGETVGAGARTLARLFLAETGLTFGQWRQRRRLLAALERLGAGAAVTTVALDLGYESPSAFTAMFRRQLGDTPTRYQQRAG